MSAQNVIELGFNVEELTAEKKQVLDVITDLFQQLEKVDGTKFNPLGKGGLTDLQKSLRDGATAMGEFQEKVSNYNKVVTDQFEKQQRAKKATDELTLATGAYKKILDDTAKVQAQGAANSSNAAENLAIEKEQLKQRNTELQAGVKFLVAETGSVAEARASIKQLTIERDKLNASTTEGKARIEELNIAIDKNNKFINENTSKIEQQKNNVGNYTGAVSILREALQGIDASLAKMASEGNVASEAYQKLTLEQKLLQNALDKQEKGFINVNTEIRAVKGALDTLTVAGLEHSEAFEKLNIVYTQSKQKLTELHEEQKLLTSESPGFTALAAAARGLGGAYALGAGASALFADGNEKLEKELNKLVAIMTVLQGLEEAVKAIRDRGAIATALQGSATRLLTLAREIEVKLFGTTATALTAETIARTENATATAAETEANLVNTESVVVQTTAMEAVVGATEAATIATVGLRTALITTGIGAIIIGIIYGITKLVEAIKDWSEADEKLAARNLAAVESAKSLLDITDKLFEAYERGNKELIQSFEERDAKTKALGKNQFDQLASERDLIKQQIQLNQDQLANRELTEAKITELGLQRSGQLKALQVVENYIAIAKQGEDKKEVERQETRKKQIEAELALTEASYDKGYEALQSLKENEAKLEENSIKQTKALQDEIAKITIDIAGRRYAAEKDSNDRILSLETSTEKQRLQAIDNNYKAEREIAFVNINEIRRQRQLGQIDERDAANQIANIQSGLALKEKKSLDDRLKTTIEYNDRKLEAISSRSNSANESEIAIEDAITRNVQKELTDRLDAYKISLLDKINIIEDDYAKEIVLAREHGKTLEEIDAITAKRDKDIVAVNANAQKDIYDIFVSYGDRKIKAIQEQNKAAGQSNDVSQGYNEQLAALNQSLTNQTVSYNKYLRDKRKLDREYSIEKAQADVDDDEKALARILNFERVDLASKKRIADAELANAIASGDKDRIGRAQSAADAIVEIQRKSAGEEQAIRAKLEKDKQALGKATVELSIQAEQELKDKKAELANASVDLAQKLVDASYEKRINQIQAQIDLEEKQSGQQIENIRRSTLNQQDQTNLVILLEAQKNAKETQLRNEQRQEKVKEAKFDRDVAAAKVLWSTAQAEIAAIGEYAGTPYAFAIAAIIAALGAVQEAAIFATPIPSYGEGVGIPGKGEHAGGPALVGELFKPEKVTIPGKGSAIFDTPTYLDLPAGSSVQPLSPSELVMELGSIGMMNGMAMVNAVRDNDSWAIARWQTYQITKALKKNNRNIQNIIHIENNGLDANYIAKKITGTA